jgi:hypothetical protein
LSHAHRRLTPWGQSGGFSAGPPPGPPPGGGPGAGVGVVLSCPCTTASNALPNDPPCARLANCTGSHRHRPRDHQNRPGDCSPYPIPTAATRADGISPSCDREPVSSPGIQPQGTRTATAPVTQDDRACPAGRPEGRWQDTCRTKPARGIDSSRSYTAGDATGKRQWNDPPPVSAKPGGIFRSAGVDSARQWQPPPMAPTGGHNAHRLSVKSYCTSLYSGPVLGFIGSR